jgi:hypothetical protein
MLSTGTDNADPGNPAADDNPDARDAPVRNVSEPRSVRRAAGR